MDPLSCISSVGFGIRPNFKAVPAIVFGDPFWKLFFFGAASE